MRTIHLTKELMVIVAINTIKDLLMAACQWKEIH